MAIKPYTVFYNIEPTQQQPAVWAIEEVETPKETKKSNTLKAIPTEAKPLLTNVPATCKMVTIEAESTLEAMEAVGTFYSVGINKPAKAAPAVAAQGTGGGGFVKNKALAVVSTELKEESMNL
jgi:hypothetical protein